MVFYHLLLKAAYKNYENSRLTYESLDLRNFKF